MCKDIPRSCHAQLKKTRKVPSPQVAGYLLPCRPRKVGVYFCSVGTLRRNVLFRTYVVENTPSTFSTDCRNHDLGTGLSYGTEAADDPHVGLPHHCFFMIIVVLPRRDIPDRTDRLFTQYHEGYRQKRGSGKERQVSHQC